MSDLLRGGRLLSNSRRDVLEFISSLESDVYLLPSIIKINQAHVIMLREQNIISPTEGTHLLRALNGIEFNRDTVEPTLEDLHMFIEEEVLKVTDETIGGNLHIAKSRNDQVSTAIRMNLRQDLYQLAATLIDMQQVFIETAEKHKNTIIPGYTHTQPAQPITFTHYLLYCFDMLQRNLDRLQELYPRVNCSPMGSCALATTSFPISRERVAELLGFYDVVENSIDAVGSRDFILETLSLLTILSIDVSRIVEDLILWSSLDFGLVELPDDFASTSSIMPQKKNPDVLEVIRARTSHILGNFVSVAASLKALPTSYNLDLQEITPKLWESLNILRTSIRVLLQLYPNLTIKVDLDKSYFSFITSTELANTLTRKYNIPFRTAHKTVGLLMKNLTDEDLTIERLADRLLQLLKKSPFVSMKNLNIRDIEDALDPQTFVNKHQVRGGPSPKETTRMLRGRKKVMLISKQQIEKIRIELSQSEKKLVETINQYLIPKD